MAKLTVKASSVIPRAVFMKVSGSKIHNTVLERKYGTTTPSNTLDSLKMVKKQAKVNSNLMEALTKVTFSRANFTAMESTTSLTPERYTQANSTKTRYKGQAK